MQTCNGHHTVGRITSRAKSPAGWRFAIGATVVMLAVAGGCANLTPKGLNGEGVGLFNQGRHQEAIARFERAVSLFPNDADGYYNLAACYHRLGTMTGDRNHFDQAEYYYNRCLDLNDNLRDCYRGLAVLLAEQQRRQEAYRLLEGWAERNPGSPDPKIELARLSEELGDLHSSKNYLIEALSVDPKNPRALAALGHVRERSGELVQALHNYRQSLRYDPFQPEVVTRVASLQMAVSLPTAVGGDASTSSSRIVTRDTPPTR